MSPLFLLFVINYLIFYETHCVFVFIQTVFAMMCKTHLHTLAHQKDLDIWDVESHIF